MRCAAGGVRLARRNEVANTPRYEASLIVRRIEAENSVCMQLSNICGQSTAVLAQMLRMVADRAADHLVTCLCVISA
jgi:hypothetical protein